MGYGIRPLDNPVNWSFRVGRLFGIDVRVHVLFVICAVVLIAMELRHPGGGPPPPIGRVLIDALGLYAILFAVVLLHEFGHCFGARYSGGEADEILLWPLGGLAYTNPPHNPRAHMITTVAGPMVNIVLCALCSVILVLWIGKLGAVPWNPLHPTWPADLSVLPGRAQRWVMRLFGVSYLLLWFNLLPIFPFDGGRILQAWLWPGKGYRSSMELATATGMVGAIFVGLFGLFIEDSWLLLMIAVFGYLTCWQTRRALRENAGLEMNDLGYDFSRGYGAFDDPKRRSLKPGPLQRWRSRRAAARVQRERIKREAHQRAVERILRKVSDAGIASLTPGERRILAEETERQRTMARDSDDNPHS